MFCLAILTRAALAFLGSFHKLEAFYIGFRVIKREKHWRSIGLQGYERVGCEQSN